MPVISSYLVIHTISPTIPELQIIWGSVILIFGKFNFLQNNTLFSKCDSSSFVKISCLLLKICLGIIIVNNLYV
jgi:hypothetical protein